MSYKNNDYDEEPATEKKADFSLHTEITPENEEKEIPLSPWEKQQLENEEDADDLHEAGEIAEAIKDYAYNQGVDIGRKLTCIEVYNFLAYL